MRPCTCDRCEVGKPYVLERDCRLCWLYHNRPEYKQMWDSSTQPHKGVAAKEAVEPGSRPNKLWKFAGQLFSYVQAQARWVAAGSPVPTPEELAFREEQCHTCPKWDKEKDGCKVCGCGIDGGSLDCKRRMSTEECPLEPPRWKSLV